MELDKTALDSVLFEGFSDIEGRRHVFMCNMQTGVTRWSKGAVDYFGLPSEYVTDVIKVWGEHVHPDDRAEYDKDLENIFSGKMFEHRVDYRIRNRNGEYVRCSCLGKVVHDEKNNIDMFVGTLDNHGIMDNIDAVTNLYNVYELKKRVTKRKALGKPIAILEVGINHFSEINDIYSYDFGNMVLKEFATAFKALIDKDDMLFRMDGVKFACGFDIPDKERIMKIFEELKEIARNELIVKGMRLSISISGGILMKEKGYDAHSVQTGIEYALGKSKHEHQGQLFLLEDDIFSKTYKNMELISAIRKSILNNFEGFYLCYQPVVSANTEELIGAEALLRWKNPQFGEVPPGIFIPLLENDACFFELGNWIIYTALSEMKFILKTHPRFILNINLAYPQLNNLAFRNCIKEIVEEVGFPPENICLELTERCRQLEKNELKSVVDYLKSLDIKIALDDFGTGFSSLNLLSNLPIDTLKIDRGFIADIMNNYANQVIVESVSNCANKLNIGVCMEGIETREMIEFVKQYPIYSYQGYFFSKPIPRNDFMGKYLVS